MGSGAVMNERGRASIAARIARWRRTAGRDPLLSDAPYGAAPEPCTACGLVRALLPTGLCRTCGAEARSAARGYGPRTGRG